MTPSKLLSLWRDRWHLAQQPTPANVLVQGKLSRWTLDLALSDNWRLPGLIPAVWLITLFTLVFAISAPLTNNSQIVLSFSLIIFALYVRRHSGQVITLTLMAISTALSARYFFWRLHDTIPPIGAANMLFAFALILAEVQVWLKSALACASTAGPLTHQPDTLVVDAATPPQHQGRDENQQVQPSKRLHQTIQSLHDFFVFYHPVAWLVFAATPVLALGFGLTPIASDFTSLCVYWLPHWILGKLALASAQEHHRLRAADFLTQELSTIAVLLRTGKSFIKTTLQRALGSRPKRQALTPRHKLQSTGMPAPTRHMHLWLGIAFFSLLAVGAGWRWISATQPVDGLQWLYLLWALFFALLLIATLAVKRESEWVRWFLMQHTRLKAMVQLPTGQLVQAHTRNFPTLPLQLDLVQPTHLGAEDITLHISLFLGYREFVFTSDKSIQPTPSSMIANLATGNLAAFEAFSAAVFSRPADWPQWLPGAHADRLLPSWLARLLLRWQSVFYNLTMKFSLTAFTTSARAWFRSGNTTHE